VSKPVLAGYIRISTKRYGNKCLPRARPPVLHFASYLFLYASRERLGACYCMEVAAYKFFLSIPFFSPGLLLFFGVWLLFDLSVIALG